VTQPEPLNIPDAFDEHIRDVEQEYSALSQAIYAAAGHLVSAERHRRRLVGLDAVDFTEGTRGKDVTGHLEVAARALRAAHAILNS
jgi:hypothetical protein